MVQYMTTIGIDFGVTKVKVKERDLKINIFDMAGHPVFYDVRNEFYKGKQTNEKQRQMQANKDERPSKRDMDGWGVTLY